MFTLGLILSLILILGYYFYTWVKKNNDYFILRKIKALKPIFLFGNTYEFLLRSKAQATYVLDMYNKFPQEKIFGFFDGRRPVYFLRDPQLIKHLAVKNFDHFIDHRVFLDPKVDPLFAKSLFSMRGHAWKEMRSTLSPAFTGSKMRLMFDLVSNCGDDMTKYLLNDIKDNESNQIIELKDFFSRFSNDVIATCAFGIEINSLKNPKNEFFTTGARVTDLGSFLTILKFIGIIFFPWFMKLFKISIMSKTHISFFRSIIQNTIEIRERENIVRQDMINLLMNAKKGQLKQAEQKETLKQTETEVEGFATVEEHDIGKSVAKLTDEDIVAQCFFFFFAGFDTVSTAMSFIAYELAVNPEVQKKLIVEVDNTRMELQGKKLSYDVLQKMKYLDMVTSEALRKWPPAPVVDRVCVKDFNLQYEDLNVKFEEGDNLWIPIFALHYDPKYFPNPDKFDPERFSDDNKHNINPSTYVPFGVGPRNCIGSRFALMETKAIIYYLLLNFTFEICEKTKVPFQLGKNFNSLLPKEGVHLKFKPRN